LIKNFILAKRLTPSLKWQSQKKPVGQKKEEAIIPDQCHREKIRVITVNAQVSRT